MRILSSLFLVLVALMGAPQTGYAGAVSSLIELSSEYRQALKSAKQMLDQPGPLLARRRALNTIFLNRMSAEEFLQEARSARQFLGSIDRFHYGYALRAKGVPDIADSGVLSRLAPVQEFQFFRGVNVGRGEAIEGTLPIGRGYTGHFVAPSPYGSRAFNYAAESGGSLVRGGGAREGVVIGGIASIRQVQDPLTRTRSGIAEVLLAGDLDLRSVKGFREFRFDPRAVKFAPADNMTGRIVESIDGVHITDIIRNVFGDTSSQFIHGL